MASDLSSSRRCAALSLSLALTLALTSIMSSPAQTHAIPFVKKGFTVAYGVGMADDQEGVESEISYFAGGLSLMLDIPVIKIELNTLYLNRSSDVEFKSAALNMIVDPDPITDHYISIPLIARFNLSPIPLLDLGIGAGYERRFYLGDKDEGDESGELNYVPFSLRADIKVPMVVGFGLETRFSYHIADNPVHDFMLLGHITF